MVKKKQKPSAKSVEQPIDEPSEDLINQVAVAFDKQLKPTFDAIEKKFEEYDMKLKKNTQRQRTVQSVKESEPNKTSIQDIMKFVNQVMPVVNKVLDMFKGEPEPVNPVMREDMIPSEDYDEFRAWKREWLKIQLDQMRAALKTTELQNKEKEKRMGSVWE